MSKYFLGSVGMAEAFKRSSSGDDSLELVFVSKTLTDTSLNISTTKDDIRSGNGGAVQFSFFHDPNVEITLTDIQWKKEYLETQLGADFDEAEEVYDTFHVVVENNEVVSIDGFDGNILPKAVQSLPVKCKDNQSSQIIWGSQRGYDNWSTKYFSFEHIMQGNGTTYSGNDRLIVAKGTSLVDGNYCVRYLAGGNYVAEASAISTKLIPDELFLIITTPIFTGQSDRPSKSCKAGYIVFEVPRYQLNGAVNFSMNMSSNQTMQLTGTAVAVEGENCGEKEQLLRIIEVFTDRTWGSQFVKFSMDAGTETIAEGDPAIFLAIREDGTTSLVSNPYRNIDFFEDIDCTARLFGMLAEDNTWTEAAVTQSTDVFYAGLKMDNGYLVCKIPADGEDEQMETEDGSRFVVKKDSGVYRYEKFIPQEE